VGAWLATIARNAAARFHTRARPKPESLLDEPADGRADPGGSGAEILAALRKLPEAYRETLSLRLVQSCSGPEIAELTPGSVRVNLSRGMKLLREALGREGWS
jgi:RNA polymerase sigma-70 factor (ECF subfamily)